VRTALVTGASRGLGKEIAVGLCESGYRVIAVARNLSDSDERFINIEGDISDLHFVETLAKRVLAEYESIDVLINAAGVFGPIALMHESDPQEWAQTIMIDAVAPYYLINKFLPTMLVKKWGRIINVSSAASLHAPGPINSAYGTAKVALNQLTRHLASELMGTGVTANVIHPGDVKTEMWSDIKDKVEKAGEMAIGYKNWVEWVEETGGDAPEKAMKLILKLISPESDEVNGEFCWIDNPLQAPIVSW
jgi:NAD(P)-dependent dehydrogenase (short-subunit alcohol dehydrogenase family)